MQFPPSDGEWTAPITMAEDEDEVGFFLFTRILILVCSRCYNDSIYFLCNLQVEHIAVPKDPANVDSPAVVEDEASAVRSSDSPNKTNAQADADDEVCQTSLI